MYGHYILFTKSTKTTERQLTMSNQKKEGEFLSEHGSKLYTFII